MFVSWNFNLYLYSINHYTKQSGKEKTIACVRDFIKAAKLKKCDFKKDIISGSNTGEENLSVICERMRLYNKNKNKNNNNKELAEIIQKGVDKENEMRKTS